jgi:FtsP/CotA-like multicopper oxidase with cupredoxin domain
MNFSKLQQGPNALLFTIIIMIILSFMIPTTIMPDEVMVGHRAPSGHTAAHDEPQLACEMDNSSTKKYSMTAQAIDLEFTIGASIIAWSFDGTVPGPVLCANIGDIIEVTLTNELDVPASFHLHLPAKAGVVNPTEVSPGKVGVFSFEASETGTFLYHDLANDNEGSGRGLHGALIVRNGTPNADHEIVVVLAEYQPEYYPGTYAATINGYAFPYLPVWNFEVGERVKVHLLNVGPSEEHTFHIHGIRWMDTAEGRPIDNKFLSPHSAVEHSDLARPEGFVPLARALTTDITVFLFEAETAGEWMYHCHIYDHINAGMMGHLEILEA